MLTRDKKHGSSGYVSEETTLEDVSPARAAPEAAPGIREEPSQALQTVLTHQRVSKQIGHFKALSFVEVCCEAIDN